MNNIEITRNNGAVWLIVDGNRVALTPREADAIAKQLKERAKEGRDFMEITGRGWYATKVSND